ncbi:MULTISPECIES: hypothetical protein [unclassified Streptomyces]|uniref:hypothetical protein n=1 Tax=unclassified Streptomyces TaxID=2593676 RepID=UPI00211D806F|nr:hypothetical protein [Streptomyces sp. Ru87]
MAVPRRHEAMRVGALWAPVLALLAAVCGCGPAGPPGATGPGVRDIQRMLDRRADALLDRDAGRFLATVDPAAGAYRADQRRLLRNLAEVPLSSWRYRLTGTGGFDPAPAAGREPSGGSARRVAAEVRLSYRLDGHDPRPVTEERRLTVVERDGRWYVSAEQDPAAGETRDDSAGGGEPPEPLWEQGEVEAVRGSRSLVLGVGHDPGRLRDIAETTDRAVPAVDAAWQRGEWARRVVVLVPRSLADMARLLGEPAANYRGIAAVTTGFTPRKTGRPGDAPADRVIVNPEAYAALGESGQRFVLTHETAHVATRAHTSRATPLWLSEGFADWAGYRDSGGEPAAAAPVLRRQVAAGRSPGGLPADEDFGFTGDSDRLAMAYERGWLACRMIADEWGERKLVDFYRAVGSPAAAGEPDRRRSLDRALREVLDVDGTAALTERWRFYVTAQLR